MQDTIDTTSDAPSEDTDRDIDEEAIETLVTAETRFSDQFQSKTKDRLVARYRQSRDSTTDSLTTVTILGAKRVTNESVTLLVGHEDEEKQLTVYKTGAGTPTMEALFGLVSANKLGNLWGEELTAFPYANQTLADRLGIRGSSDMTHRLARKVHQLSISTGVASVATPDHPYSAANKLTPTPQGLLKLFGLTTASAGSIGLLAKLFPIFPDVLTTSVVFMTTFYLLLSVLVVSSTLLFMTAVVSASLFGIYLFTGESV